MERLTKIETTVNNMQDMVKQLVEVSKSQPTPQQYSQEHWNAIQQIITAQRELAEAQHNHQIAMIKNMVDARYKDTQADIKAIREALTKMTGTTPTPIFRDDDDQDDAKKGEKHDMKKFRRPTPKKKPTKKLEPEKKFSPATDETFDRKEKGS
ncbi:hypothetical protein Hanom_Chr12g01142751 [Helianthus anomalus]